MTPDAWVAVALFAASWLTIAAWAGFALGRAAGREWPLPTQPDAVDVANEFHAEVDGLHEAIVADFLAELEQYERGGRR